MRDLVYKLVFFVILACLLVQPVAQGQIFQQEYAEFEIEKRKGDNYSLVPTGEEGVLCLLQSEEPQKNNRDALEAFFLDTELNLKWQRIFLVDNNYRLIDRQYTRGNVYLLLEKDQYEYQVMRINLKNGDATFIDYQEVKNFYITQFTVMDSIIFFGGTIRDNPGVIRYNYDKGTSVVCPSINQLKADLVTMDVQKEMGIVTAILKSKNFSNDYSLYINTYSLQGKLLYNFSLPQDKQYNFLTFRPYHIDSEQLLIFGTYALKTDDAAQGIFVMKSTAGSLEFLRFYDFGYLKFFFDYLPEKKKERMLRRIERKREKDKIYQLRYNLFVHELKVLNGQILFAADVYDPIRDSNHSFYSLQPWSNPLYGRYDLMRRLYADGYYPYSFTNDPLFNNRDATYGFEFMSAFACGFDKKGNLLWDNSFTTEDVSSEYPIEFTNVLATGDTVFFVQADEQEFRYKISGVGEYTDSVTVDSIAYLRETDKLNSFENGGIADWYNKHFLVSGLRDIRNKMDSDMSREIFFIQKISVMPPRLEE